MSHTYVPGKTNLTERKFVFSRIRLAKTLCLLDSLWNEMETLILCFEECYNQIPPVQINHSVNEDISIALKEYKVQTNWHLTADCEKVDKNIWVIIQRGHKSVQSTLRKSIIPFALKERNGELAKNCNLGKIQPNHLGHTVGVYSASGVIPVLHRMIRNIIYSSVGYAFLRCVHSVLMRVMETHIDVLWGNPTALTRSDGTGDG